MEMSHKKAFALKPDCGHWGIVTDKHCYKKSFNKMLHTELLKTQWNYWLAKKKRAFQLSKKSC